jgi:hypothetical protein
MADLPKWQAADLPKWQPAAGFAGFASRHAICGSPVSVALNPAKRCLMNVCSNKYCRTPLKVGGGPCEECQKIRAYALDLGFAANLIQGPYPQEKVT